MVFENPLDEESIKVNKNKIDLRIKTFVFKNDWASVINSVDF